MRALAVAAGILLGLQGSPALACGFCEEDRIAAVYSHDGVTRAMRAQHRVVYFAIDGVLLPGAATRRAIEALAESAYGVDKGSARVSLESASLAIAFDPKRASLAQVLAALDERLSARKLSLLILRVVDKQRAGIE